MAEILPDGTYGGYENYCHKSICPNCQYKGVSVNCNVDELCLEPLIESHTSFQEISYEKVFKELTQPASSN